MFHTLFKGELEIIETHLRALRWRTEGQPAELTKFWESLKYSLFSEGKRFRPLLSLLTAKALRAPHDKVLPLAAAVELIHTYSLIHDDLPCMDDDDFRRGRPSHHKMFGEAGALLAGDALLTQAFGVLAQSPSPKAATVVALLSESAGAAGMVGGQVLDLETSNPTLEQLETIHRLKTGALIQMSVVGAALLCEASPGQVESLKIYGEKLGLAFQIADDLQDFDADDPEKISYASVIGVPQTLRRLESASKEALKAVSDLGDDAEGLRQMVRLNQERV